MVGLQEWGLTFRAGLTISKLPVQRSCVCPCDYVSGCDGDGDGDGDGECPVSIRANAPT